MTDTHASRVLITGAAGFLGSFLVDLYLEAGWDVHGTYRTTLPTDGPSGLRYWQIDLADADATRDLIQSVEPWIIVHLAAQSSVSRSWADPASTYRNNVLGQSSLFEAAVRLPATPTILVAGSSDEYGAPEETDNPISEDRPLLPVTPYGVSKVAQDLMAYQYFKAYQLPIVRIRPFLQIGPRRSDSFFAGSFARQVAEIERGLSEPVITVGPLDLVRDMTDVRDVARACVALIERGHPGDVYNVGTGTPRKIGDVLEAMIALAGIEPSVRELPSSGPAVEPPILVSDYSKLRSHTGWNPTISFEDSVRGTLDFWRDRVAQSAVESMDP